MRTIIISDCHVGSPESNYRHLNRFLRGLECDRLILAGDFWDLWDVSARRIRERYDDTVRYLRRIMDAGTEVVYVLGNHDEEYLDDPVMDGFVIRNETEIELSCGKRYAVIHGHDFDHVYKRWYWPYRASAWVNKWFRKVLGFSTKSLKKKTCVELSDEDEYSEAVGRIHDRARKTYREMGYDGLIMGHTHSPVRITGGRMDYINAGDWKWSNTYVEILGDDITLKRYGGD
jgi:UDP-2,3-diacylglucosamine pyrophosphatase LpxH